MTEINLSVMECSPGDANNLLPLMEAFEKQYHIHVNLSGIAWYKGWTEVSKFGIFGQGPDVSTIGTTWIGSLAAMHSLRPFTPQQIRALGGEDAFFESIWKTGFLPNDMTTWAIPWLGDALVLYYWEEFLKKADIANSNNSAFGTDAALVETLEKLQKSGCAYPLSVNLTKQGITLHEAAHWLWNAGGNLVSPNGQQVIFNQPLAMQGWKNYFSLRPFISPTLLNAAETAASDYFLRRESAVQVGGPYKTFAEMLNPAELKEQPMGAVQMPGFTFTGGTSFVVWQYSSRYQEAFELVRFLSSQPTRIPAAPHSYELPTRREAMYMTSVESNIFHRAYMQAMQTGRSFPTMRLWGSIEDKLTTAIAKIWEELYNDPDQDLDACLHRNFDPVAERLNVALGN